MPTTETPNPASQTPDQPENATGKPAAAPLGLGLEADKGKSSRYTSLGTHELITLVEDLEDERAKARVREGIWISVIVHLILFWYLAYGPQVLFHRPRVVNPSDILAKRDAQFLDLPPDALKAIKPKRSNIISDKDRVAQSAHPTLDKKTLQQLEAMKAAGPPAPAQSQQPQPQPQPQPRSPQAGQQASQQPPAPQPGQQQASKQPPTQPLAPSQQSQLEMPKPAPTVPNFTKMGGGSVGDQIRSAAQNAARGGGSVGGNSGMGAPSRHPGQMGGMEILSDTMGVDFGPYMARLKYIIERTWWPIIPEEAMSPLNKKGITVIRFKIGPDGTLESIELEGKSGTVSLDRAAWGAIKGSQPLPPLPKDFKGPFLEIRGGFFYNMTPDDLKQ